MSRICFAHRGASDRARENTLQAFALAVGLGATGIETDVWATADGIPVLDHDGIVIDGTDLIPIRTLLRRDLPEYIPTLSDLYETVGTGLELSIDVLDEAVVPAVLSTAESAGGTETVRRLWLCHPKRATLERWRSTCSTVRLVWDAEGFVAELPRAATITASAGIDALNLHHSQWSLPLAAACQQTGLKIFGWGAETPEVLRFLALIGIDGVYSDHVDRMMTFFATEQIA